MKVLITGGAGFLGWHLQAHLQARGGHEVVSFGRHDLGQFCVEAHAADAIVHLAGANRGSDHQVEGENVRLAHVVADAVCRRARPVHLVFANSVQAGNPTAYGQGKARAREVLATAAKSTGSTLADVVLPNLFGEHGRPNYNSFVATFVHVLAAGETPRIDDRAIHLLHAQDAAQILVDALEEAGNTTFAPPGEPTTVCDVWRVLEHAHRVYATGEIPPLTTQLEVDLFNTLRAAMFPRHSPVRLTVNTDHRGGLVECVRAHGGQGQTFVSTTMPGVTRGEHFHLRKVERFVVLKGRARIALRKLRSETVISFDVDGDEPVAVDMPTMWVHNICNTGTDELVTLFWTHTLFDPREPDTYPEQVETGPAASRGGVTG